jgi:hypothetical protein
VTKGIGYKNRTPGSLHEVLSRAFDQAGGVKTVADILPGRTVPRLYEATSEGLDPRHEVQLSYAEVRLLARAGGGRITALAEDIALLSGGMYLPPINPAAGSLGAQAGRLGREFGEAMAKIYADLEDGVMTPAEAAATLPQIREFLDAGGDLFRMVQAVIEPTAPPEPSKP